MKTLSFISMIRLASAVTLGAATVVVAPLASVANAADCKFEYGFALLHTALPAVVGDCVSNEVYDAQGSTQVTTNGQLIWHQADNFTGFTNGYIVWANTLNGLQSRLVTQRFTWEPNPDGLSVVTSETGESASTYLDDRSNEYALIDSWANALNRREYVRAYSYWEANATQLAPFEQFQAGYAAMASVKLDVGAISEDAAAGNRYASVPVVLTTQTIGDGMQTFAGCYTLHIAVPAIQEAPPFAPWGIREATVWHVANDADHVSLLANACPTTQGLPSLAPLPLTIPNDVTTARYLDDRSTAPELIRSMINALNRHEYLRAYAYWDPTATQLQSYAEFKQGYAKTDSIDLKLGTVLSDAGAGQRNFTVPALLISHLTDGTTQTFAGCYQLHLSEPSIQGIPPFQPLAIKLATIQSVAATASLPNCSGT
jgi:hypothetical protein